MVLTTFTDPRSTINDALFTLLASCHRVLKLLSNINVVDLLSEAVAVNPVYFCAVNVAENTVIMMMVTKIFCVIFTG